MGFIFRENYFKNHSVFVTENTGIIRVENMTLVTVTTSYIKTVLYQTKYEL